MVSVGFREKAVVEGRMVVIQMIRLTDDLGALRWWAEVPFSICCTCERSCRRHPR